MTCDGGMSEYESILLDIQNLVIPTILPPFSLGCKLIKHPLLVLCVRGSLEITSRTLATVMCHAEDPCSVNTAHEPESSLTSERLELPWPRGRQRSPGRPGDRNSGEGHPHGFTSRWLDRCCRIPCAAGARVVVGWAA